MIKEFLDSRKLDIGFIAFVHVGLVQVGSEFQCDFLFQFDVLIKSIIYLGRHCE